jgi:putative membrane protein
MGHHLQATFLDGVYTHMSDSTEKIHQDFSHPKTPFEYLRIYLTGFVMGCADIVPGVSGGTIAFISGIYETLINAIKSFNLTAIRKALKFDIGGFIDHTALRFLITLALGIGTAVLLLANLLSDLLENQPTYIFAFFAGLIIASILAIGITVKWGLPSLIAFIVGAVFAFVIVSLPETGDGDHSTITLFLSGAVAICAMILPGISGSFILLILGQYKYILEAVKGFEFGVIIPVALGCVVGIIVFSRVLSWLLKNYVDVTVAVLTGFMLGSLKLIWDNATNAESVAKMNSSGALDGGQIVFALALMVAGFILVSLIDHMQSRDNPVMRLVLPKKETPAPADSVA